MSGATTTPTLDQPPKVPPKPLSPLVDGATQSASPVTGGSAVFLINQRSLAGGTGGAASPSTAPVTQPAATQATQSPDAWNAASGTLAAVESQLAQLKVWAAPDAAAFEAALGTLKSDAAQGKYAEALASLKGLATTVATAHGKAKAKADWTAFEATDGFKTVDSQIKTLAGWPEAAATVAELKADVARLRAEAVDNLNVGASVSGFDAVKVKALAATGGWTNVRVHNFEINILKTERKPVARIESFVAALTPADANLTGKLAAYKTALAKVETPVTALAGNELLAAARTDYAARLKDLQAAFEAKGGAAATDAYWNEKREQRWATMRWVHQKALSLPPKTPEASALTKEIQALWTPPAGAKAWYEANERMYAKCIELIALRSQPEQDQTAFEVQFGKLEKTFNAAAAVNDNTEPTKTAKTTFDQTFSALKARRDGNEPTRFTDCKAQLPTLLAQARAVLDKQIAALKSTAAGIKAMAPANDDEKRDKAGQAATALTGDPIILEQLGVDEKLDLLDAMRARPPARPMPSPPNPPGLVDPNDYDLMLKCRKAQRALYKATPLDDKFVAKDKENRAKMIDALKLKKKELQGAQDGWKAMTPDQKKATFESVIEDQCKAFGFEKATLVVEDFGPANSSNGAFDPVTNTIRVNSGAPACDDFELAMDLILHENTHNYQKQLALRLDATDPTKKLTDPSDPLYTQARLFKANNAIGGYVPPGEEYEAYEKQPTEAHAWIGGSQAARMVMEMLATQ